MQQDNKTRIHKTYRKLFIIVISILMFVLFFIATVFILKSVITNENNSKSISASEVINNINNSADISSLSSKLYQKQINNSSSVDFELNGKSYSVNTQTKTSTLFFAISKSQTNDSSLVQTQITSFMNKFGFVKATSPDASINELTYTTFDGYKAVCQLEDTNPPADSGMLRSHKISCVNKTDINNEYTAIEKLLSIYNKSQVSIKFTKAVRITKTDKNVAYSTIYLSNDSTQSILLFAAVNDNWEYLGDLSAGDKKYSTGMYIITPEIKAKINDPKYNGLITQEIH